MSRIAAFFVFIAFSQSCFAQSDEWTGKDKVKHAGISAAIAAAATAATDSELIGFGISSAVGFAKEVYDMQHKNKHTASFKDLAADLAGAYVGAKMGGLIISPRKDGFTLTLRMEIK